MEYGKSIRGQWLLDEDIIFLNHGSFGACPKPVLEVQSEWRVRLEREPVRFLIRELPKAQEEVQTSLAEFISADAADIVFVENATAGINAVLRSLASQFKPGDELLTTTHAYGAIRQTMQYIADTTGAIVVDAEVPFPLSSPEEVIDAITKKISDKTVFAVVDHITSPTGVIFPIEKIIPIFKESGIPILIDGAHAPGMIDLSMSALGADYYAGNCHKWLNSPKGSAFLWVDKKHQSKIHPTIISHFYGTGFQEEFAWGGTFDPSAMLSIKAGIAFTKNIGITASREYCKQLVLDARKKISESLGLPYGAPVEMLSHLCSIPVSYSTGVDRDSLTKFHDIFFDKYNIEIPALTANGNLYLRFSANVYNESSEYDLLLNAMREVLGAKQ